MSLKGMALSKMIFNPLTTHHFVDSGPESRNKSGVSWTQGIPPRTIPLNPNFSIFQSNHRLVVCILFIRVQHLNCIISVLHFNHNGSWKVSVTVRWIVLEKSSLSPEFASALVSPLQSEHAVHRKTPIHSTQTFLSLKSAKKITFAWNSDVKVGEH